ncbi:hypothetical protein FDB30_04050 [Clostridium botulinum]|uniref:Uncharacterized protein n=1 Tax=Clostridium botulinum TaxID=1491 RepID=A0A846K453_CLOBO|nr:hypothetical protein [Clostridium botulinum]KAI3350842.1 hypothetical protein CIT18_02030 [Clostridium botulinum]KOM88826.1 hypothetical protein ACP51_06260 [Clostridium botulinum]KOR57663.1 hypothetical protein ADT22_12950 [Clostridium botulinum]NFE12389.1 hypothetical protein [Clostridium botulinum]NFE85425.1 hypothetical protein [Clostridium botulinum]
MKTVMNHQQYLQWKNGDKNTLDIKLENLGVKDSKKFEQHMVVGLAIALMFISKSELAFADDGIDQLGNKLLYYVRKGGRWIAIICASVEIIRSGMKKGGSASEIGQVVIKYSLMYACLYILTWIFDQIDSAF